MTDISPLIKEKAPLILAEIKKAKSILLHCHPSPDPDSVGSALAMKLAIEQIGGKATVIKGDSEIPQAFMHFPGAGEIVMKSWWEIDPAEYDLFIIIDSSLNGVSRPKLATLPDTMKVINIDHHRTNTGAGSINVIDTSYPATGQLLFDIFKEMSIVITPEIAINLFIGIYTDTGGFKYEATSADTFRVASELVKAYPDFPRVIARMENSNTLSDLAFQGLALSSIEKACDGKVAFAVVPYSSIIEKNIPLESIAAGSISSILRSMDEFAVVASIIEAQPDQIKMSFRTNDADRYDVSKIAALLGGGGHKAAAGVAMQGPLAEVKQKVVEKLKELYNL